MKKVTIKIKTVNTAFDEDPKSEVATILRTMADFLEDDCGPFVIGKLIRDTNGNPVGKIKIR